jgi:HEAT repeat-containing protein 5
MGTNIILIIVGDNFVGEIQIPSNNARLMIKLAVLCAWAEVQIQSTHWDYLVDIVEPHIGRLVPLWLGSLTAYAKLQFEPDVTDGVVIEDIIIDPEYSNASKEFLLQARIPREPH